MSSSFKIETLIDRTAEVLGAVAKLARTSALAGIPEDKAERTGDGTINNATMGYIHENGSDRTHIPRREFMKPGVAKVREKIDSHLKEASRAAWDGDEGGMLRGFNKAGQVAVNSIRGMFDPSNNNWQPVTPATKLAKGEAKTTTLVDTGQLRKSITHVVEETG